MPNWFTKRRKRASEPRIDESVTPTNPMGGLPYTNEKLAEMRTKRSLEEKIQEARNKGDRLGYQQVASQLLQIASELPDDGPAKLDIELSRRFMNDLEREIDRRSEERHSSAASSPIRSG